jgi:hypothetical protein
MKLYRAEVSPLVDLMVDASESMRGESGRAARTEALVAFCLESATRAGAPARLYAVEGRRVRVLSVERARAEGFWAAEGAGSKERGAGSTEAEAESRAGRPCHDGMGRMPWRAGAMKVWVSDLLFPGEPGAVLNAMAAGGGCALVFAPVLAAEAGLAERGNVELVDREGGAGRRQRIDDALAERYRAAYARHFSLWREAAKRAAVGFARVDCAGALTGELAGEARLRGVVEALA